MEQINLSSPTTVKVVMGEKSWDMRKPKMQEAVDLDVALKAADEKQTVEIFTDFLDRLGFPKAEALNLTTDQMNTLVEGLLPKKKA